MAGTGITISLGELVAMDGRLAAAAERARDLYPLMDAIGQALETTTHERFEQGEDPQGVPWKTSQRVELFGGQTLRLSGVLEASIGHNASSDQIEIGSNLIYARPHDLGWPEGNLPQRQFIGLGGDDEQTIVELAADYLLMDLAA